MLTLHDRRISSSVVFRFLNPTLDRLQFQFPPKILTDSRSATWDEGEVIGREPEANLAKTGARTMALSWTYIVESIDNQQESIWTIEKIRTEVNRIRGYMVDVNPADASRQNLIVMLKHDMITGRGLWSCRIKDVNVKHSDNLMGRAGFVYPQRTDITVDMRLWTTGIEHDGDRLKAVQQIQGLYPEPKFGDLWY